MDVRPATEFEANSYSHRTARFGSISPAQDAEQFQCAHCDFLLALPLPVSGNNHVTYTCPLCHQQNVVA